MRATVDRLGLRLWNFKYPRFMIRRWLRLDIMSCQYGCFMRLYVWRKEAGKNVAQEVGEDVIKVLAQFIPDINDCIVDWCLFTPWDLEQRVGLTDGNIRHLDTIPDQFLDKRPLQSWAGYSTPLRHLYLCGAGTHPGGDVTGAPGHNAAHVILKTHC